MDSAAGSREGAGGVQARGEVDREVLLVDDGVEPAVFEVLRDGVELVQLFRAQALGNRLRHETAHEVAVFCRLSCLLPDDRAGCAALAGCRTVEGAGAAAGGAVLGLGEDESALDEALQVLSNRVRVETGGDREIVDGAIGSFEEHRQDANARFARDRTVAMGRGHDSSMADEVGKRVDSVGDMTVPACSGIVLGVIGAGRLGLAVARLASAVGMTVRVAGSGPAIRTRQVVAMFAPGAEVVDAGELLGGGVVVLAMPLSAIDDIDPAVLRGTIVIDAMNYWPETDGVRPEFDDPSQPTSTLVAKRFADAQVVKALNHVAFRDLEAGAKPVGSPYRIGIGVAGEGAALDAVADVVRCLGFDPVVVGSLAESGVLEPRGPVFGAAVSAAQLRARIDAAR